MTSIKVPFDLSMITLDSFLQYREAFGRDLDKKLSLIINKKYTDTDEINEIEKSFDIDSHLCQEALSWYSFWTRKDIKDCMLDDVDSYMEVYKVMRFQMRQDEGNNDFPKCFMWNDEVWVLPDYKVVPSTKITFNEIITSKEVMHQLRKIEKDRYDGLLYVAAIFLRKKDEAFKDEFIFESSERMELFKSLPMDIAIQVGFFLIYYVRTCRITSVFSIRQAADRARLN